MYNIKRILCLAAALLLMALPVMAEQVIPIKSISLAKVQSVEVGAQIELVPKILPAGAQGALTWTSDKPAVATVKDGVVTGVKAGKATITVKTENGKKARCAVTVKPVSVTDFTIHATNTGIPSLPGIYLDAVVGMNGHKLQLSIKDVVPSSAQTTVRWKSSNPGIASVNSKGVLQLKKAGKAVITATAVNGKLTRTIPVDIMANEARYDFPKDAAPAPGDSKTPLSSPKRIYLKDGAIYADIYLYNAYKKPLRLSGSTGLFFSYDISDPLSEYSFMGMRRFDTKKAVASGAIAVVTVKVMQTDPTKQYLLQASAFFSSPQKGLDAGDGVLVKALARR